MAKPSVISANEDLSSYNMVLFKKHCSMTQYLPKKAYDWLTDASQHWQSSEIISSTQRQQILASYQIEAKNGLLNTILMMIAMLLIGGGAIMLIAHNWQALSYLQRAVIAIIPVLMTQIGLLYTIIRFSNTQHLARESVALLHGLSVGAAIALISQTYHLYGQISDFFQLWLVLLLPITYLARAHSLFILALALIVSSYLSGFDWWRESVSGSPLLYGGLIIGLLPYLYFNPHKISAFSWVLAFSLIIVIMMMDFVEGDNLLLYLCLYSGLLYIKSYMVSILSNHVTWFHRLEIFILPLKWVGGISLLTLMIYVSSIHFQLSFYDDLIFFDYHPLTLVMIALYAIIWLVFTIKRKYLSVKLGAILVAAFPLFLAINTPLLMSFMNQEWQQDFKDYTATNSIQQYMMIAYLIVMSLQLINEAIHQQRWVKMNVALLLIIYLLMTVFLQNTFDLVYRGIAFIIVGLIMVGLNVWIMRRYRHAA